MENILFTKWSIRRISSYLNNAF